MAVLDQMCVDRDLYFPYYQYLLFTIPSVAHSSLIDIYLCYSAFYQKQTFRNKPLKKYTLPKTFLCRELFYKSLTQFRVFQVFENTVVLCTVVCMKTVKGEFLMSSYEKHNVVSEEIIWIFTSKRVVIYIIVFNKCQNNILYFFHSKHISQAVPFHNNCPNWHRHNTCWQHVQ